METRGRKRKPDEGKTRKEGSGVKRIATSLSAKLPAQPFSKSAPVEKGKSGGVRKAQQAGSSKGLNLGGGDEGVLPQDLMNQLSGKTVPTPEQQDDPIRQIMNKGVEDLRKERGLEKTAELAKTVTSVDKGRVSAQEAQDRVNALVGEIFGPELEQGEINEDQAMVGSKNTTDTETTVPTGSTVLTDQPLVSAPKSIVLTAPTSAGGIIHPDRVPSIPEKNVGKRSSELLKGKSPLSRTNVPHEEPRDWAKFKADGGVPQTLEQMFQIFKDFERKNEAAFNRLNRDSKIQNDLIKKCDGNVDALRKDFSSNHSMIAEHTKQFTVVYERAAEDAKFYRDENRFLKERIDHLSYQIHLVNQSNQSNTPQDALKTQAGTSAGVPLVSAQVTPQVVTNVATLTQNSQDVITVPRDLHYNMYNDGYEESLIRAARRGLLREEALNDKRVVSSGFRRYAELVQAFNSAGENFHIQRPRGGPSYESQDRGRH